MLSVKAILSQQWVWHFCTSGARLLAPKVADTLEGRIGKEVAVPAVQPRPGNYGIGPEDYGN